MYTVYLNKERMGYRPCCPPQILVSKTIKILCKKQRWLLRVRMIDAVRLCPTVRLVIIIDRVRLSRLLALFLPCLPQGRYGLSSLDDSPVDFLDPIDYNCVRWTDV